MDTLTTRKIVKITQRNRTGILTTPLGEDVLCLVRFEGHERLSQPFEYVVEALSEDPDVNFDDAIGQQCSVKIKSYKGEQREFNGIMVEALSTGMRGEFYAYRVVLRPWLWLLSKTSDSRVFHEKTAPQIIEKVFKDRGFLDFEIRLQDSDYPKLDYCVQYRETDFNFVSRLMEEEGIYYFCQHDGGKHTLVLADSKSSHRPIPKHETLTFNPDSGGNRGEQRIARWTATRRFRSGKFTLNDYNYEKPNVDMLGRAQGVEKYARKDMEIYDFPGNHKEKAVGERYAKIQLQAEQAADHRRHGSGDAICLFPGGLVTLKNHGSDKQNIEYLVVSAVHTFGNQRYRSEMREKGEEYHGQYEFQPSDRPFRAPIVTPKPRIYGVQTAKVVNKNEGGGDEIDVEKLTEVYVWFYWDRKQHDEPKRSCKVRVAQTWSGKKWGGQFIPRVGMEVVVEFLEGDPDRPLIVGCVYNDDNQPPYDLPGKKTQSGFKSDSTNGGGGYNELMFDDKKGSELIRMHAQKDHEVVVENNEDIRIGNNQDEVIGNNQSLTVGSNRTTLIGSNDSLTVASSRTVTVAQNQMITTAQNVIETTGTNHTDTVGANVVIMAGTSITLMAGGSTIILNSAGVQILAPTFAVVAPGGAVIKGATVPLAS